MEPSHVDEGGTRDETKEEVEPRLVRRRPTALVPKLCPYCLTPMVRGSGLGGWLVPQDYRCPNCGYKGYVYVENRRG